MLIVQLASSLLGACTAPPLLTSVLGPPVKPQEVKHGFRRPTYTPWKEFTMAYNFVSPVDTDWGSKLAVLPKSEKGEINWVKAVDDGMIKPKPGLEDNAEDLDTEDNIVELIPPDSPDDKAVFPHLPHTKILACPNCHPAIFKRRAGADPITMKAIKTGQYCGRCHGPVAFGTSGDDCDKCHPS